MKKLRVTTAVAARPEVVRNAMRGAETCRDSTAEFEEYMNKTWPKTLVRLKARCEAPRS